MLKQLPPCRRASLAGRTVGDIGDPQAIGAIGLEATLHEIGRRQRFRVSDGRCNHAKVRSSELLGHPLPGPRGMQNQDKALRRTVGPLVQRCNGFVMHELGNARASAALRFSRAVRSQTLHCQTAPGPALNPEFPLITAVQICGATSNPLILRASPRGFVPDITLPYCRWRRGCGPPEAPFQSGALQTGRSTNRHVRHRTERLAWQYDNPNSS